VTAADIIAQLGLSPHPEGGFFRETYRHSGTEGERGACTAIYFLLVCGRPSRWHRVKDAEEIWHYYAGAPVDLGIKDALDSTPRTLSVGPDILDGMRPQQIVPAGAWQMAETTGEWSLVGCTVSPAFTFDVFEMAP